MAKSRHWIGEKLLIFNVLCLKLAPMRVGHAIVMAQCLNARLMPPVFAGHNRTIYYAAMQHAMKHGRYAPLIRLFYEATQQDLDFLASF